MICKKCSHKFNRWVSIDGTLRNLSNRKFCLDCSPFGKHNTKDISLDANVKVCTKCKIPLSRENSYKKGNRLQSYCKKCFTSYCVTRWINRKLQAIKYKGSKCIDCEIQSTSNNYAIFDFHHLDPTVKEFEWSKGRLKSWDKVQKELDKCVLLCANCHRLRHNGCVTVNG